MKHVRAPKPEHDEDLRLLSRGINIFNWTRNEFTNANLYIVTRKYDPKLIAIHLNLIKHSQLEAFARGAGEPRRSI